MRHARPGRVVAAVFSCLPCIFSLQRPASAQEAPTQLNEIVVTATRGPLDIQRAGSAIDVLDHDDIQRTGATTLRDALQSVPGLFIHSAGGIGAATNVSIRGATPGETLILLDGVRLTDPTGTDNAFDLGNIAATDIERIEVLRGPQSALYGSDAIGGVIQIITRKGEGPPKKTVTIEGGSYGTAHTNAAISGSSDGVSYAFSVDALHTDGFPRYGDRPLRSIVIGDGVTPLPKTKHGDFTNRVGVTGRLSYALGDTSAIEFGVAGFVNRLSFDNPYAVLPGDVYSPLNRSNDANGQAYAKLTNHAFGDLLTNQLTLFTSGVDRSILETESCPEDFISTCRTNYHGVHLGAEYQGDINAGPFGHLTFGLRSDTERAFLSHDLPVALGGGSVHDFSGEQTIQSAYALHQVTLFDRLDLSEAVRVDGVVDGPSFVTARGTVAYRITETGSKLRASIGSGAKIASLYQRFGPYGLSSLQPEQSVGVDGGLDQSLFGDRLTLSATYFSNQFANLIDFTFSPALCPPADLNGCYFNVGRAETHGVELGAKVDIEPGVWRATGSYTYMDAIDETTSQRLLQQPRNKGVASLIYTGVPNLRLEGRVTVVAGVLDFGAVGPAPLAPWARLDAYADYKVNDNLTLFARLENVSDARYEEVYNYSVPGRSIYGGVRVSW